MYFLKKVFVNPRSQVHHVGERKSDQIDEEATQTPMAAFEGHLIISQTRVKCNRLRERERVVGFLEKDFTVRGYRAMHKS